MSKDIVEFKREEMKVMRRSILIKKEVRREEYRLVVWEKIEKEEQSSFSFSSLSVCIR